MNFTSGASFVEDMLSRYGSPSIRPGDLASPVTTDEIEFHVGVDAFNNIDQTRQRWSFDGYFRSWWKDPRLAFDEQQTGKQQFHLTYEQAARIWQPDLYLEKLVKWSDRTKTDGYGESWSISSDGTVFRSQQGAVELRCPINLRH